MSPILTEALALAQAAFNAVAAGEQPGLQPMRAQLDLLAAQPPDELDAAQIPDLRRLCVILELLGERDAARALATAAIDATGDETDAAWWHNFAGLLEAKSGRLDEAASALRNAMLDASGSPFAPTVTANLAMVALKAGDLDAAVSWAERHDGFEFSSVPSQALAALVKTRTNLLRNDARGAEAALEGLERTVWSQALTGESLVVSLLLAFTFAHAEYELAQHDRDRAAREVATEMLETVSQRLCAILGAAHPYAAQARFEYELVRYERMRGRGDPAGFRRCIRRLEAARRNLAASLGEEHPRSLLASANIASGRFELARITRNPNDMRVAIADLDLVAIKVSMAFGADHPQSMVVTSNAATAGFELARLERSAVAARHALDGLELAARRSNAVFGPSHPASLIVQRELLACRALAAGQEAEEPGGGGVAVRVRAPAVAWHDGDEGYISYEDVVSVLASVPGEAEEFLLSQAFSFPGDNETTVELPRGAPPRVRPARQMADGFLRRPSEELLTAALREVRNNGVSQVIAFAASVDLLDATLVAAGRGMKCVLVGSVAGGRITSVTSGDVIRFTFDINDLSALINQMVRSRALDFAARTAVVLLGNLGLPREELPVLGRSILHGFRNVLPAGSRLIVADLVINDEGYHHGYVTEGDLSALVSLFDPATSTRIDDFPDLKSSLANHSGDERLMLAALIGQIPHMITP